MAGNGKSRRGFASMDAARQKEIASKGGRAAHSKGTAHEWSSDEARVAGRKGGEVVSRDRAHMAAIGREGGEARGANARAARATRFSEPREEFDGWGKWNRHYWRGKTVKSQRLISFLVKFLPKSGHNQPF